MPRRAVVACLAALAPAALAGAAHGDARCLPDGDGFLAMRLRGSIEAEVRWSEPGLSCTGMPRPDRRGLRLRFAGALEGGGELAVVFAAPELEIGASGRGVPANVTLLDAQGERIFGTRGDSRCTFDEVEQRAIVHPDFPPGTFRVSARGFCVAPARAVDGEGAVLLTRFDFAGRVSRGEEPGESDALGRSGDPHP